MATIKKQVIIVVMGGGHVEPRHKTIAYRRGHLSAAEGWGLLHSTGVTPATGSDLGA